MPLPSSATQQGSWEIGLDVAAEFATRDFSQYDPFGPDSFEVRTRLVDVPQGAVRIGYFITDALSLESTLGLSWAIQNPGSEVTDWEVRVGIGATYALAPSSRISPFLSTGVRARYSDRDAGYSVPPLEFGIPIEGGVRIRIADGHSIRIQSGVMVSYAPDYFFSEDNMYWTVPVRIGWSLDTKAVQGGSSQ